MTDEQISFERRNYYDGETLNQMRHGYGVYVYENKFFRYEGDWVKGKKHGNCFFIQLVCIAFLLIIDLWINYMYHSRNCHFRFFYL